MTLLRPVKPTPVVVDVANLAKFGLHSEDPFSYSQFREGYESLKRWPELDHHTFTLIADCTVFRRGPDADKFKRARDRGEIIESVGYSHADPLILKTAERDDALVVSHDRFRNHWGEYPWILEEWRIIHPVKRIESQRGGSGKWFWKWADDDYYLARDDQWKRYGEVEERGERRQNWGMLALNYLDDCHYVIRSRADIIKQDLPGFHSWGVRPPEERNWPPPWPEAALTINHVARDLDMSYQDTRAALVALGFPRPHPGGWRVSDEEVIALRKSLGITDPKLLTPKQWGQARINRLRKRDARELALRRAERDAEDKFLSQWRLPPPKTSGIDEKR